MKQKLKRSFISLLVFCITLSMVLGFFTGRIYAEYYSGNSIEDPVKGLQSAANTSSNMQSFPAKSSQEDTKPVKSTSSSTQSSPDESKLKDPKEAATASGQYSGKYIYRKNTDEKVVCLTFDDGPDGTITPEVLDILDKYNIKGTFFFIGNRLAQNKDVVERAFEEGHLVLSHSWDHADMTKEDKDQVSNEFTLTENQIYDIIGKKPDLFRPPYGAVNSNIYEAAAQDDSKVVLWSVDPKDWTSITYSQIASNVLKNVKPGSVILMHTYPTRDETVKALPIIITRLQEMGYKFEDIAQMFGVNPYKN